MLKYDIYHLMQADVLLGPICEALPAKFAVKGIALPESLAEQLISKQTLFAADWEKRLAHLLPLSDLTTFQRTWDQVVQFVHELDQIRR